MKYEVIRAWYGVEVGDVIETEKLHDALTSHVRPVAVAQAKKEEPEPEEKPARRGRPPKDKE